MPRDGYIRDIRELVGNRALLLPSATTMVRRDGALLMGRHRDTGRWVPPGGALEPGETPADAAVRETWEETGLLVRLTGLYGVYGGTDLFHVQYPNGDVVDHVVTFFTAEPVGGEPAPFTEELTEIRWVRDDEIDRLEIPDWVRFVLGTDHAFQPAVWTPASASDDNRDGG